MKRIPDFCARSVAAGLRDREFEHLSERDRRKLVRLMARIAEKAYRRGAQHGAFLVGQEPMLRDNLASWRIFPDLDKAPYIDSPYTQTSIERLFMECGGLREIGFREPSRKSVKATWTGYSVAAQRWIRAEAAIRNAA